MSDNLTDEKKPIASTDNDDMDFNISNTGQRIRAILVLIIVIAAAGGAYYWWTTQKQKIAAVQAVKNNFRDVHKKGYESFWEASKIKIKDMKNNQIFEAKLKEFLSQSSISYATYMNKKALPILESSIAQYKKIEAPAAFVPQIEALVTSVEGLHKSWKEFTSSIDMYEDYLNANEKLTESGDAWLGAQGDHDNEEFTKKAVNYVNTIQCVLGSKVIYEVDELYLGWKIKEDCKQGIDRVAWFKRVAKDCMPKLLEEDSTVTDLYTNALEKYVDEFIDKKSVFSLNECLDKCRDEYESFYIGEIAKAWAAYVTAQNALLSAVDDKLKELK